MLTFIHYITGRGSSSKNLIHSLMYESDMSRVLLIEPPPASLFTSLEYNILYKPSTFTRYSEALELGL